MECIYEKSFTFLFFLVFSLGVYAQEQRIERVRVLVYPEFTGERIVHSEETNSFTQSALSSSPIGSFMNPTAPPEAARANAIGHIPVNLYTGAPVINLPIYTVTEGRLNLPLSMSYNHSIVKPTAVAGWTGLGFDLAGIPTLSRIIRGFPDEGYVELDGYNYKGQKGYYFYGHSLIISDQKQDKEPDYFFINTPSGSGKFVFDGFSKAHFFPGADIKVEVSYQLKSTTGHSAYDFTEFIFAFPDGIKYYFSHPAVEESAEIDAKFAKENGIYPNPINPGASLFTDFLKQNMVTSAWYCTKIVSPYGEIINLNCQKAAYTYYRLVDNEAEGLCPGNVSKGINKVYVRGAILTSIETSSIEVNFNTNYPICTYNETTHTADCNYSGFEPRLVVDSWGNTPTNSSYSAKQLRSITVKERGTGSVIDNLTYKFGYEYYEATRQITLPTGYIQADIGETHKKRLKLKYIIYPGGDKHTFSYENENNTPAPSRFTYGVDHWGYRNTPDGINSNYGFIGSDELSYCGTLKFPSLQYAKDQMLSRISHSSGSEVYLEYELNDAKNYSGLIGGLRVKSITSKDGVENQLIKKNYSYTQPNQTSSGFFFIKPIYRINYAGLEGKSYALSNLYDFLYAESGRPIVGYSRVTETITNQNNGSLIGKTITYFDRDETEGMIKDIYCTSNCNYNPSKFNLRQHDFRGGQILKTDVYNENDILIQKTENTYNQALASDEIDPGYTYCIYKHPKSNSESAYLLYFRKYRLAAQTTTQYSPSGGQGVAQTVTYTYKDQMPQNYRNKYKGRHNMPVMTTTTDEENNSIESRVIYTADFRFVSDTIDVCSTVNLCPEDLEQCPDGYCIEKDIIYLNLPYGHESKGIDESLVRNILTTPIETRQVINGQTIAASYTRLYSDNNPNITLPQKVYSLKKIPKNTFQEVVFQENTPLLIKDADYGNQADTEILSYNTKGFPVTVKNLNGVQNQTSYITPVIPGGGTANFGKADALTTSQSMSLNYLGIDKVVSANQLERKMVYNRNSGRPSMELDKDNRIIRRYDYLSNINTTGNISWASESFYKTCLATTSTIYLKVSGISSTGIAQFSINGGTWQNANSGTDGFIYTQTGGTGLREIKARSSNNYDDIISTTVDITCEQEPLEWDIRGVDTQSAGPPPICVYTLSVKGLSPNGIAQFSYNGNQYINASSGNDRIYFTLIATSPTQQFWARDANNPLDVISTTLNTCQP